MTSLREGGDELLTFFRFPKAQWKTLRTTNVIERLHEEFRRRVKTQGSLPSEDAAVVLLFSLVTSGQIRLRRIDGWCSPNVGSIPAFLRRAATLSSKSTFRALLEFGFSWVGRVGPFRAILSLGPST